MLFPITRAIAFCTRLTFAYKFFKKHAKQNNKLAGELVKTQAGGLSSPGPVHPLIPVTRISTLSFKFLLSEYRNWTTQQAPSFVLWILSQPVLVELMNRVKLDSTTRYERNMGSHALPVSLQLYTCMKRTAKKVTSIYSIKLSCLFFFYFQK